MKVIRLTNFSLDVLIDDEDYEYLSQFKWHLAKRGYAVRSTWANNKPDTIYMHREIMQTPRGMDTDHIDLNKINNQRSNLRICTRSQNMANLRKIKKSRSRSKYTGVSKKNGRWFPYVMKDGKMYYMGTFETEKEAVEARNAKALELFGEYATLNDIT